MEVRYSVVTVSQADWEYPIAVGLPRDEAAKLAAKLAAETKDQVFVSFFRPSDSQHGYLNQDGNHAFTGKAWKAEPTFEEMAERALEQIAGDRYAELISKAKHAATYSNTITDDKENWDKNAQWLVADMADVARAYFVDYAIEEVFGTNPAEGEGPEEWCKRHGIEILG